MTNQTVVYSYMNSLCYRMCDMPYHPCNRTF